jgi:hypothetical protein
MPTLQPLIPQQRGVALVKLHHRAHRHPVIGHHQEVKGPGQLHALAGGRGDRLASREPVGFLRAEPVAESERIG